MPQSRQLAAILFTDIEGYTAAMQQNEPQALMLKDRHRLILENEHKNFNGTILQYYGDGTLSIFSSAVNAVRCAVKMQQFFCQKPLVPVRMGLHVGDVIMNDGHVFGDGVNLASRIESLGVAGSVLISDKVNDEIRNQPDLRTISMGRYYLKNVEREVEVFALNYDGLVKPTPNSLKGKTQEKKTSSMPPSIPKKSVAVLPFINISNDPEQEYFSEGIAEEILNSLAHLNDLKVAGRTSSFQFRERGFDLRRVGHRLGVHTVLEGSVRKQGNRLRVTVQLVSVEDGFHLWSEKYDRQMDDIFAIQDEIALSVTEKLKITLLENEKENIKAKTENKEAYDYYLKGRFYWNRRGTGLKKGLDFFLKAIELDPNFSLAHSAIAETYALFAFHSILPPHQVIPKARQAAERAIELSPSRIEPYSVLAYITAFYDWNWAGAKRQFEKAFAINSDYAVAHYWYCNFLTWVERDFAGAETEARKAMQLEPLLAHSDATLASVYICSGKFEEARILSEKAIELDTGSFLSYCSHSMALHGLGRNDEAIQTIKLGADVSKRHQYALLILSWLYGAADNVLAAEKILEELSMRSETEYISGLSVAVAAYASKKYDMAIEYLERAFEERASLLISISGYPFLSFIKTDPKFQSFLQRMNYPEKPFI